MPLNIEAYYIKVLMLLRYSARLGPTDADLVDVIHTDGNARYLDYIPQVRKSQSRSQLVC